MTALLGAAIGASASFATSWLTQQTQLASRHRDGDQAKRERLFGDFIGEASRLYGDALSHQKDDVTSLVALYALLGRIRLVSSPNVIHAAEEVLTAIAETYQSPNRGLHELRALAKTGGMDAMAKFSEVCRRELDQFASPSRAP
jgi:hypothetical protein